MPLRATSIPRMFWSALQAWWFDDALRLGASLAYYTLFAIAPILIVARLEEFAYGEATAIAAVLLVISFAMLVGINLLERWSLRHEH